jgi:hypothetical protein
MLAGVTSQEILIFICILVGFPLLLGIRRRRESIRYRLSKIILVEGTYLGLAFVLIKAGRTPLESILGGMVAALFVSAYFKPRSRHIPASVKRKAKAEFELRTGKKFNPRKHEYDHDVPFSRGGSHTGDNLRVVEKRSNRSKGAKSPWWDLLGR